MLTYNTNVVNVQEKLPEKRNNEEQNKEGELPKIYKSKAKRLEKVKLTFRAVHKETNQNSNFLDMSLHIFLAILVDLIFFSEEKNNLKSFINQTKEGLEDLHLLQ